MACKDGSGYESNDQASMGSEERGIVKVGLKMKKYKYKGWSSWCNAEQYRSGDAYD